MAIASNNHAFGRVRQRIVAVARVDPRRGATTRGRAQFAKDKRLRVYLQSGVITREQMEVAIGGFAKMPSDFTWLIEIDEAVLEKADRVFLAKHGRSPVENSDFVLNGDYHKICRSLQHDPRHYDEQLERAKDVGAPEVQERPREPKETGREEHPRSGESTSTVALRESSRGGCEVPHKKSLWPFITALVLGLCSAPVLGVIIATYFSGQSLVVGLVIGSLWLVLLLVGLVMTFPR